MMRLVVLVQLSLLLASCSSGAERRGAMPVTTPAGSSAPAPKDSAGDLRVATALAALTTRPACLVVRWPDGSERRSSQPACAERRRPASTFKLPNALIGAELGLLDSAEAILPYDAQRYPAQPDWPQGWAQPQPLRAALELSAVPLFRGLAVRIGAARMRRYLDLLAYGNATFSDDLDHFWLDGKLAISADEQVAFLARLAAGTLPVSARAHAIVRAAMPAETQGDATMRWKTGTARAATGWIAWLVGWIERPEGTYPFACRIDDERADMSLVRADRLRACRGALAALGLMPAPAQ